MVSQAVVIATGVSADGRREVLGCAVGDSETADFWAAFLRTLRDRGLGGIQLVISDHHRGLMNAIEATMAGERAAGCHLGRSARHADVESGQTDGAKCAQLQYFSPCGHERSKVVHRPAHRYRVWRGG